VRQENRATVLSLHGIPAYIGRKKLIKRTGKGEGRQRKETHGKGGELGKYIVIKRQHRQAQASKRKGTKKNTTQKGKKSSMGESIFLEGGKRDANGVIPEEETERLVNLNPDDQSGERR